MQCQPGFALSTDGITCTMRVSTTKALDLYVVPFNGFLMDPADLLAQQSVDSAFGESLETPFAFI